MFDKVLKFGLLVLKLMCKDESAETCTNCDNLNFSTRREGVNIINGQVKCLWLSVFSHDAEVLPCII